MLLRFLSLAGCWCLLIGELRAAGLSLEKGDHLCLIGNALGEGLQHHNQWETLLHQRFPRHELVVRNLCFPGDEAFLRLRSENFGEPDVHLRFSRASVVLMFFGLNESFAGEAGLAAFAADMTKLVEQTKLNKYDDRGPPRIVLVSPIAFENTGDPNLPDGREHNARLQLYTSALHGVAEATGVSFADVFTPTLRLFEASSERLTMNGVHLNARGYAAFGPLFNQALFGTPESAESDVALQRIVDDKNFHWWHRYRAVNGYSIYGTRGEAGSDGTYRNREVMEREREILDQMTANRDARIWTIAAGLPVSGPIDDSNTLPFIVPKTNVGIKDDPNAKNGKLGSLDYLRAEEQQKLFKLAPGYQIDLVASEEQFPELANPVALNFDSRGRLWVATMPSYPHWQPKTPMDDKLLILEDQDQDGRADSCQVFAGGLHQPTGFELGHGGVFVAQQPDILFLKDRDGDDREDFRERRLFGFDSADSHHGLAAFRWGPDGGLYFQEGTFKYSQVESAYGLKRLAEGGIWRYDPRTERFSIHANFAFSNPWGHVFDRWGQDFIGDASPGFSYWAAPITGRLDYPLKHPGGSQHKRVSKMFGGDPDYQFPTFYPKRTRPLGGCEIVSSRHFPEEVQGNWLVTNCITDRAVLNHTITERGSGYVGQEVPAIVSCDDGNFRPVDAQFAPDGTLYIVDWHNALIGHLQHNLREPNRDHSHGRIWRVSYPGRPRVEPAKIHGQSVAQLLELLRSPENNTRYRARRELNERPSAEVVQALSAWVASLARQDQADEHALLEALWVYQGHHVIEAELLQRLLEAQDHRARAAAVRALSFWIDELPKALDWLEARVADPHPLVRLEATRALSFSQGDRAAELALRVLAKEPDDAIRYTVTETLRVLTPTRLFLDMPPSVVAFQLNRLSNKELISASMSSRDRLSLPVLRAVLTRPGLTTSQRQQALQRLAELTGNNPVAEILEVMVELDRDASQKGSTLEPTADQLLSVLLEQPASLLADQQTLLSEASRSDKPHVRRAAFAGLIRSGQGQAAKPSLENSGSLADWLRAMAAVPDNAARAALRAEVISTLEGSKDDAVRQAAVAALATIPTEPQDSFRRVSALIQQPALRTAAVRALLSLPEEVADPATSRKLLQFLVKFLENTKPANRTEPEAMAAMQLCQRLLAKLPGSAAEGLAERLQAVQVQVVDLRAVEEQMRYDVTYFAVEAGREVQIVFHNDDVMPHNLVVTEPGALRQVAEEGLAAGTSGGWQKKAYVPKSKSVLFATDMVPAFATTRLTFTAPKTPGEYPYVCTFPQHWMRMYGVMVVVDDLKLWQKNPVKPKDPIGNNRSFVKNWQVEDLQIELEAGMRGRNPEIGKKLFTEATCAGCHQIQGQGGRIGPELTGVFQKWKGDRVALLREVIDPSHKIDDKYAMRRILTVDGQTLSGIVIAEDKNAVSILASQEATLPTVIARADIEEMNTSKVSMMPKALLDQYTQDEIFEILAYLESVSRSATASE
jgi:putative membrane-bound dehydrogenase-like protein